ncbi:hypothetical protein CC77DRAFT_529578 [Alternaria alternata]|uniref:Uncharacterized protein n=1 Tax=Alternaria alternata TaxID=5599 RepID=A0A177DXY6_ALTAL|nr:hypothetical protein CC77DRAFT_529578 [Alternaria alternata]OAG24527.1 hypothetical protein CC77DRAFT_529578 [Alternaria alternata]
MVLQPLPKRTKRRCEKSTRFRGRLKSPICVTNVSAVNSSENKYEQRQDEQTRNISKKHDSRTTASAHAQDKPKTNAADASTPAGPTEAKVEKLKWPLPPSSIHDGLLFRKVG